MAKKKGLSDRQKNILQYIADYTTDNFRPPTIREIGKACTISSTSVVNYNLNRLVDKGLLRRDAEVSRGLSITDQARRQFGLVDVGANGMVRLPLLGNIVAGEPIPFSDSNFATYEDDDALEIGSSMLNGDTDALYALRVSGDSMIDALVNDGDLVILRQQTEAKNGDMVAARIISREETTLKYYFHENGRIRLQPANPSFEPIEVPQNDIEVQGVVKLIVRQP